MSWGGAARLALGAAAWLGSVGRVPAQQPVLTSGRVVRLAGTDTIGVGAAMVVLHRVGHTAQGPIDSARTGPRGEFQFRFAADTSAVYLLSSGFAGIEYFSTPVEANAAHPDTGLLLIVSDTSTSAPLQVTSRYIVIGKPAEDGTRAALEIVTLHNAGTVTRVAGALDQPTWGARLPAGVLAFQAGHGDVSPEALQTRHDSVLLFAPVAPGEKQLVYTYQLPAAPGTVQIPFGDSVGALTVLLEEFDRSVSGGGIARADSQRIEKRTFQQWSGAVASGAVVAIDFPGNRTRWLLPALVGLVGLALLAALIRVLPRRAPRAGAPGSAALLDALAQLDARYAGREAEVGAEEWAAYLGDRARLKTEIAAQLAGRQPPP